MSTELVILSNHPILCHLLLLLPSMFPSIRVFSNESALCIRWPKYWASASASNTSNEYSGLIFFRIDWFDLLAVQGTLLLNTDFSYSPTPFPNANQTVLLSSFISNTIDGMQILLKYGNPSMSVRKYLFCLVMQFIKLQGIVFPSPSIFLAKDKCYHSGLTVKGWCLSISFLKHFFPLFWFFSPCLFSIPVTTLRPTDSKNTVRMITTNSK